MDLKIIQNEILNVIRSKNISDSPLVVSDERLHSSQRLNTYKRSSYLKPQSCLTDDFLVTKKFLGKKSFDELIDSYLLSHPADTHFVNECGRHLPSFVAKTHLIKGHPFINDLVLLEWMRVESFYDFFDYRTIQNPSSQLIINPSIKKLKSSWPMHKIWHDEITHEHKTTMIFIWTTEDRSVHVNAWPEIETRVLLKILESSKLESAIEDLLKIIDANILTEILTLNLTGWINKGLFEIKSPT